MKKKSWAIFLFKAFTIFLFIFSLSLVAFQLYVNIYEKLLWWWMRWKSKTSVYILNILNVGKWNFIFLKIIPIIYEKEHYKIEYRIAFLIFYNDFLYNLCWLLPLKFPLDKYFLIFSRFKFEFNFFSFKLNLAELTTDNISHNNCEKIYLPLLLNYNEVN